MTLPQQRVKTRLAIAMGCLFATTAFGLQAQQEIVEQEKVEEEQAAERISVVGSRIRTGGFDNAAPVSVINAQQALSQGLGNLGELLRSSTLAAGSNQVTSASSTAFVESGGTGAETLSLRGLGANRTLVLLNGRRAGPAGTRGEVASFDMNVIPLEAIDRVEILKDGASSLYGSDAVAGVINIITKKGDDSSINFNTSQPFDSGGETMSGNATFGRSTENGSFRLLADYKLDKELAKGQRDFYNCGERYVFNPTTGERADLIDPRTGSYHCNDLPWGQVWIYDYQDEGGNVRPGTKMQYDYAGNLGGYIPGLATDPSNPGFMQAPAGWFPVGYDNASDAVLNADHPFQDLESLIPRKETITLYGQGDYSLTDDITVYGEALLNRRETNTNGYRQFWTYTLNETYEAFGIGTNPTSVGWSGDQWLSPTPITDHSGSDITVDYRRFVVGANGSLGDWFWDVSYQDSHSDGTYTSAIIFEDAVAISEFATGSCVGETTAVRGVACIDVPWLDPQFLAGNISQQHKDFLFGYDTGNTVYKQQSLEGFITGDLMDLPGGPLGSAFGFAYQRDSLNDTPGEHTLARNVWGASAAGITQGKDNSKAIFAEFQIPLLSDLTMIEALDFTTSARYTDVASYGNDTTYKVGLNWTLVDGFRFRASQGTSFRSPALYELYLNDQTSFVGQRTVDPCINWGTALEGGTISQRLADNCAADGIAPDYVGGASSATVISGGGAGNLEAETSISKTYGFVWTPDFINFSASIDYFDIEIDSEVTELTGPQIVRQCYLSENFATDPLCDQFDRATVDQRIETVRSGFLNIASQRNRGVDIETAYDIDTEYGTFVASYEHTIQLEASRVLFASSAPEDFTGDLGSPKHVGNFRLGWSKGDWNIDYSARYVGSAENYTSYGEGEFLNTTTIRGQEVRLVLDSDAVIYHSLSVTNTLKDYGLTTTLGVANLLDEEPPRISFRGDRRLRREGNSAFYSQYDSLGRRVFLNLSYQF
ncbi:outer membrane receptor for ferrienterochelin and colicins [Rheinheimera sp. A13L]|uniref:TonB-dependent receptor domain-containing protein n=1 Tax=Rheinheimera sp. A13L TaxID=506534 RepID=UPI0002124A14|nr:TonB-dependent receptor [Rheinheimera sp. A13L]EGM78687.1 outer membrane receptor for ferrienterochelin and colicins [Rheinheimera sp. A13L]